eukprot:TRINITY_DN4680_c2_g1_i1.p1 TRINITY_DN4680_c2_g1~~TRINITY_DN4680_c2_g1_i1.p1  ORF type:complete len:412 (+),score=98.32 TRINITY_DN4680_c2_g1_i1:270-1505(+)
MPKKGKLYRAKGAYAGTGPNELTFKRGSVISISEEHEQSGWAKGAVKNARGRAGKEGWFPRDYVEEATEAYLAAKKSVRCESGEKVTAVAAFAGTGEGQLQFEVGDQVTFLWVVESGWSYGSVGGKSGWFPSSHTTGRASRGSYIGGSRGASRQSRTPSSPRAPSSPFASSRLSVNNSTSSHDNDDTDDTSSDVFDDDDDDDDDTTTCALVPSSSSGGSAAFKSRSTSASRGRVAASASNSPPSAGSVDLSAVRSATPPARPTGPSPRVMVPPSGLSPRKMSNPASRPPPAHAHAQPPSVTLPPSAHPGFKPYEFKVKEVPFKEKYMLRIDPSGIVLHGKGGKKGNEQIQLKDIRNCVAQSAKGIIVFRWRRGTKDLTDTLFETPEAENVQKAFYATCNYVAAQKKKAMQQ